MNFVVKRQEFRYTTSDSPIVSVEVDQDGNPIATGKYVNGSWKLYSEYDLYQISNNYWTQHSYVAPTTSSTTTTTNSTTTNTSTTSSTTGTTSKKVGSSSDSADPIYFPFNFVITLVMAILLIKSRKNLTKNEKY